MGHSEVFLYYLGLVRYLLLALYLFPSTKYRTIRHQALGRDGEILYVLLRILFSRIELPHS